MLNAPPYPTTTANILNFAILPFLYSMFNAFIGYDHQMGQLQPLRVSVRIQQCASCLLVLQVESLEETALHSKKLIYHQSADRR